jgi:hypothetical protein
MGAWGHRTFENDSALDWLGDLAEGDPSLVGEALDVAAGSAEDAYLEVDEASAALAAAELERVYERSELRELWDENGEETDWHIDVRELLARLSS